MSARHVTVEIPMIFGVSQEGYTLTDMHGNAHTWKLVA